MRTFALIASASILVAATAVGVSAEDEPLFGPMTPARIDGGWVWADAYEEGQVEQLGELMFQSSGGSATYHVTSGDPRFKGTATVTGDWISAYPPALVSVADRDWRIKDDAGAWMGSDRRLASMADEDPLNVPEQVILDGSGAYEGLTAFVIIDLEMNSFVGAIIPDQMPVLPDDWLEVYQATYEDDPASDN
jgi:hypothetical protein